MKINRFESELHRELYRDLLKMVREEEQTQEKLLEENIQLVEVVTPSSSEGYEWLIYTVIFAGVVYLFWKL